MVVKFMGFSKILLISNSFIVLKNSCMADWNMVGRLLFCLLDNSMFVFVQ